MELARRDIGRFRLSVWYHPGITWRRVILKHWRYSHGVLIGRIQVCW